MAPSLAQGQQTAAQSRPVGAVPGSVADDSLETWRLGGPALSARCQDAVTRAKQGLDTMLASAPAEGGAFKRLQEVELASAALQLETTMPRVLQVISPDSTVRTAAVVCDQRVTEWSTTIAADPRLYALARRAQDELGRETTDSAAPADRRLAQLYVEQGRNAGAGLDSATRAHVVRLFQRHADLERNFSLALASDSTRIRIPLRDSAGLDQQFRAGLTRDGDSLAVPVDESTSKPFMEQEADRAARQRFFAALWSRGGPANVARLDTALAVRDTLAHLLGFPDFASYKLSTRMARTPGRVTALLSGLKAPLRQKAVAEVERLRPYARRDGIRGPLEGWDYAYYVERLRRARYALSQDEVQQYFPVDHVLPEVMRLYSQILGVRFQAVSPARGWAPEVSRFMVLDSASGAPLGRLYFDLYPRPHKYQHFADFTVVPTFQRADGSRQLPWTAIIGNWPRPAPGHPSLLTHDQVVVLFHEFGHAIASVLDQSPYPTTSGYRLDFVEAPSQMLENWMWQPEILRRISRNVSTGKALPDSMIRTMLALKHLTDGNSWGNQTFYATYDMTLHTERRRGDLTALWDDLFPQFVPFKQPAGTIPEASFGHIMGGYEAGYYGYLWAKVYAQDMFSRFEREGVLNPRTGRAYRDDVLAPSGTEDPEVLVRRFLGRPVSYAAFYRELGIKAPR
ncbi:MAG: M3 family metallopeptidase [Gemmatimonadales bacterium]